MEQRQEARKGDRDYAKDEHDSTVLFDLKKKRMNAEMLGRLFSSLGPHRKNDEQSDISPSFKRIFAPPSLALAPFSLR